MTKTLHRFVYTCIYNGLQQQTEIYNLYKYSTTKLLCELPPKQEVFRKISMEEWICIRFGKTFFYTLFYWNTFQPRHYKTILPKMWALHIYILVFHPCLWNKKQPKHWESLSFLQLNRKPFKMTQLSNICLSFLV